MRLRRKKIGVQGLLKTMDPICTPMFRAALFTVAKNVKITVNFFLPLSVVDNDNQS